MLKTLIAAIAAMALASAAIADISNTNSSNSASSSGANVSVGTSSGSFGSVSNTISNPSDITLKSAPGLGSLALGGGHPCAFAPATGQISILGAGAGVGGMKVDDACMLMIMGYNDPRAHAAAIYMIASRNLDACHAMQMYGMVTGCDAPRNRPIADAVAGVVGQIVSPSRVAGIQCVRDNAGNLLKIYAPAGTDNKAAQAACR